MIFEKASRKKLINKRQSETDVDKCAHHSMDLCSADESGLDNGGEDQTRLGHT